MNEHEKRFLVLCIMSAILVAILSFMLGYSMGNVACYDECIVSNNVASRCLREHNP